jgi:C1A family cysteine protease
MLKSILALTAVSALATPETETRREFTAWMAEHGKTYETEELFYRYDVFKANMAKIEAHNADTTQKFTMGHNQFMDLTSDEFARIHMSGMLQKETSTQPLLGESKSKCTTFSGTTSETTVDWVAKGRVSAVKNQEQCGSCWSFSTTGSLEAAAAIAANAAPVPLSEQQLMDCSWSYGNMGCNGGLMDYAFEYLIDNGGSCTEESYPYTEKSSHTCKRCTPVTKPTACQNVPQDNPEALKAAIAKGPVSVAIQANQASFQFYKRGVLTGLCGKKLDHGVLAVGFDDAYSTPYWKVKNSWGETWGMEGYVLIEQKGDRCGVAMQPSLPIV